MKEINIPEINADLAYLCGVLAGDGYIKRRYDKHEYVVNCGGNPKDEIEFYDYVIKPLFRKIFRLSTKTKLLGKTYGFNICSKRLVNFLLDEIKMQESPKTSLRIPRIFLKDEKITRSFLSGLADTDFSYQLRKGTYPIIKGSSNCKILMIEVSHFLEKRGFNVIKLFDYKLIDKRFKKKHSIINKIDINGHKQFVKWINLIGTRHPKNIKRIQKWKEANTNKSWVKHLIKEVK
jgi:hypothetical protein